MNSKILVATHKPYHFPQNDLYTPIHVGKAIADNDFGYMGDDHGENISEKNRNYCELTALYWAWKNDYFSAYRYCGLSHYRRYFKGMLPFGTFSILSEEEIDTYLDTYDILLPKKRKYYIETVKSHYANAHNIKDLDSIRDLLIQKHSDYTDAFDMLMQQRELYLFNMFIMKKELFDSYMKWLFEILFELEKKIDISGYDQYQSRLFGFVSERLFNVWIIKNKLSIKELNIVNIEGENLPLKAYGLLKRKFFT